MIPEATRSGPSRGQRLFAIGIPKSMRTVALCTLAVIVGSTLVANSGLGEHLFAFLRYIPGGDVTGHLGLYLLLGYTVSGWARRPASPVRSRRWVWILIFLGVLVTLEELSQIAIPSRTFSLVDLLASLAGLLVGATISSWKQPNTSVAAGSD